MSKDVKKKYGRSVDVKLMFRETTGGSSMWGPWNTITTFQPSRKTYMGKQLLEWLIKHGWVTWDNLIGFAFFKHVEEFGKTNGEKGGR